MANWHYNKKWVKWLGILAITIGNSIYTWKSELHESTMRHELKHVEQYNRYKPFMVIRFIIVYMWQWIKVGFVYRNIPFEIEAREAENEI